MYISEHIEQYRHAIWARWRNWPYSVRQAVSDGCPPLNVARISLTLVVGLLSLSFFASFATGESSTPSADDSSSVIRARIAALSQRTARNTAGHFVIIGSNRVANVVLVGLCEDMEERISMLTGIRVPFENRMIRLHVDAGRVSDAGGARVQHSHMGETSVHDVYLANYDAAYSRRGRQALCHAMLAGYINASSTSILNMPPWLWKGIERNLVPDESANHMEDGLKLWSSGGLATVWDILDDTDAAERNMSVEDENRLVSYSVFVRWLSSLPGKPARFRQIFETVAAGKVLSIHRMESLIADGGARLSLDESWDRWLVRQRRVVFTLGMVSTRIIGQLRSELLLYRGACGIPLGAELRSGASMVDLLALRREEWMSEFIKDKRSRLDLLAAGRTAEFQRVVLQFGEFLSNLESDVADTVLLGRLRAAYAALNDLAEQVRSAGGAIRASEVP
jgi:hypothetical protein